jgi:MFS family permease
VRLHELGFGAVALGATWLCAAALEAAANPVLGHVSDRVGRMPPLLGALAASTCVLLLLPWPEDGIVLAGLVVCSGISFGIFWAPAMSLLSDHAEAQGLDYGYGFAVVNLAWAPGQALGAWASAFVAAATSDAVPYLGLAAVCSLTLALLWRSRSSS